MKTGLSTNQQRFIVWSIQFDVKANLLFFMAMQKIIWYKKEGTKVEKNDNESAISKAAHGGTLVYYLKVVKKKF